MKMYPKEVAKGKSSSDGTYIYTCNACNGSGRVGESECSWCYGLDTKKICYHIKVARGQRYYALLKAFLSVNGKKLVAEYWRLKKELSTGMVFADLASIALRFDLNFKATMEWLEETDCIWYGLYDDFIAVGGKVKQLNEEAYQRYPDLQNNSEGEVTGKD